MNLPLEIHIEILSYLPVQDLISTSRVNHFWNRTIKDERIWKLKHQETFKELPKLKDSWYWSYRWLYSKIRRTVINLVNSYNYMPNRYLNIIKSKIIQDVFDIIFDTILQTYQALRSFDISMKEVLKIQPDTVIYDYVTGMGNFCEPRSIIEEIDTEVSSLIQNVLRRTTPIQIEL